jgi:hypothetical protein
VASRHESKSGTVTATIQRRDERIGMWRAAGNWWGGMEGRAVGVPITNYRPASRDVERLVKCVDTVESFGCETSRKAIVRTLSPIGRRHHYRMGNIQ